MTLAGQKPLDQTSNAERGTLMESREGGGQTALRRKTDFLQSGLGEELRLKVISNRWQCAGISLWHHGTAYDFSIFHIHDDQHDDLHISLFGLAFCLSQALLRSAAAWLKSQAAAGRAIHHEGIRKWCLHVVRFAVQFSPPVAPRQPAEYPGGDELVSDALYEGDGVLRLHVILGVHLTREKSQGS